MTPTSLLTMGITPTTSLLSCGLSPLGATTLPPPNSFERSQEQRDLAASRAAVEINQANLYDQPGFSLDSLAALPSNTLSSSPGSTSSDPTNFRNLSPLTIATAGTLPGTPSVTSSFFKAPAGSGIDSFSPYPNNAEKWLNAYAYNPVGSMVRSQSIDEEQFTYTGSNLRVIITPVRGDNKQSRQLLELTTLTISLHREKAPVRALGYINPKGFARGKRTIAGTMILTQFTVDTLYRFLYGGYDGSDLSQDSYLCKPDQLPPFNATLLFSDEYGHVSYRRILGIDIVDSGEIYSVNDMLTEQTLSYMASDFTPLLPAGSPSSVYGSGNPTGNFPTRQTVFDARAAQNVSTSLSTLRP